MIFSLILRVIFIKDDNAPQEGDHHQLGEYVADEPGGVEVAVHDCGELVLQPVEHEPAHPETGGADLSAGVAGGEQQQPSPNTE